MGVIIIACEVLELIIEFFAAIDFKSLEKAQWVLFNYNYTSKIKLN